MKNITSCFLGIPLPEKCIREFGQLLNDVGLIDPTIKTVYSQTPHITIYYLNIQSQYSLEDITKRIQPFTSSLNRVSLKIEGFNYFTEDNPNVLFLDVKYPKSLTNYRNKVVKVLEEYSASDNSLSFHPHVTVGYIKSMQAKENFKINKKKLTLRLSAIDWMIKIKEIALYGVDSTSSPEHQEILLTIPVK